MCCRSFKNYENFMCGDTVFFSGGNPYEAVQFV